MYDSLPKNEKTCVVSETGDTTGLLYEGSFTFKCILDISSQHALELEKTQLTADLANPTQALRGIAITLATVRAHTIKAPDWWKETDRGAGLLDNNIVFDLLDKVIDAGDQWRESLKTKAKDTDKSKAEDSPSPN